MAGIFKSIDQSDIRVTPFQSHKLWSDSALSYRYTTSSLTSYPVTRMFANWHTSNQQDNTFYVLSTNPLNQDQHTLYRIDGEEDFQSLAEFSASYAFSNIEQTNSKILAFTSNSVENSVYILNYELTAETSYSINISPLEIYDTCFIDTFSYKFVGMKSASGCLGLFEAASVYDWTNPDAAGDYWGVDSTSDNNLCTLFKSGSDVYLAVYMPSTPGYVKSGPFPIGPQPTEIKDFFVYQSDPLGSGSGGTIWMLFSDHTLYLSDFDTMDVTNLGLTDVAAILLDNDYYVSSINTYQTQRVHIITRSGLVYLDAHYDYLNETLVVGAELDLRSHIGSGLGNVVQSATINRNAQTTGDGDAIISIIAGTNSGINESIFVTVNTNTQEIGNPTHLGSVKSTTYILGYNSTRVYAADSGSSINVSTGGFKNNWYTFNL